MARLIAALLLALSATGCAGVVAGAMIQSSMASNRKADFQASFARTNSEREANGQEPLDWCSEVYRFDRGWAMSDGACAARIRRYEHGDSTALDPPGHRSENTVAAVPESVQAVYDEKARPPRPGEWRK